MIDASKLRKISDCKGRLKEMVGDEGVLKLAEDGICPHYKLTNPITNEVSIWFIPSEINEWFDRNYVKYNEGYFTPKFDFLYFNRESLCTNEDIPNELLKIKDLYKLPIDYINTPPGIYFLCKQKSVKYVGQAVNVASRIIEHVKEGYKDFDEVYYITCPITHLVRLESALIKYFQPELNLTGKKNPKIPHIQIVESLMYNEQTPTDHA